MTSDFLLRAGSCAIFMKSYPDSKNFMYPAIYIFEFLTVVFMDDDRSFFASFGYALFAFPLCVSCSSHYIMKFDRDAPAFKKQLSIIIRLVLSISLSIASLLKEYSVWSMIVIVSSGTINLLTLIPFINDMDMYSFNDRTMYRFE